MWYTLSERNTTMERGTKLYRICNGNLAVVRLVKEQIVDGATLVTYTVQDKDGRKSQVGTDYYQEKKLDAWNDYIDDLILDIQAQNQAIHEAHLHLKDLERSLSDATIKKNKT